jgi:L-ribulose-5-phosphate 3-epimerase
MTFDQVVEFATRHGIKYLQFIGAHLDPAAPKEESLRKKALLDQRGLVAYSFGVNRTSLDKEANRKLFEFARLMDIKVIIVEPRNLAEWDNLEELVREYDIKLAIHNHGTGTVYGDPATVRKVLAERDRRIGVCLDIGWVTAAGFDAAEVFRSYGDRVYDMHFKDKKVEVTDGKPVAVDTEIGKGHANYGGLFAEIKRTGWSGVLAIETDSRTFQEDPNRLVGEAKAFFQRELGARSAAR